jgi:UDP-3-O-[3-hydroxymyristoyl] N-acetylglucosamine deacetylase
MEIRQQTLKREVATEGVGLFTGNQISLRLCPQPENSGIVFQRMDLPNQPRVKANLENAKNLMRSTGLCQKEVLIQTVEHLLSALNAYQIDNLCIQIFGSEVPIGDGSALFFVQMIEEAGIEKQRDLRKVYSLKEPLFFSEKEVHLIALPSDHFCVSFTLHFPHSTLLRSQYFSFSLSPQAYKEEVASARTFSFYEEIEPLLKLNLIKGGGLENALLIREDRVMNPEGMRYPDELVRHKIVDLIGDFALMNGSLLAHIIAIRSGHAANISFAKKIVTHMMVVNSG